MKFRFPGLKILDRYIIGKYLSTYFFSIAMIIVVLVIFDYAEKIDDFTELSAPWKAIIFDYYLNFVPFIVNQFSSLFAFISVIFFTSKMAYQTEIIAMLSGGMSFRRLMYPYFVGSFIIASISLSLNLWVIPVSQKVSVEFESKYIKRRASDVKFDRHIYRQVEPGTFVYIRGYDASTSRASFFAIEKYIDNEMVSVLEASDATLNKETKRWTAARFTTRKFDEKGSEVFSQYRNLDSLMGLDINELGNVSQLIKTMKIGELNEFLEQQRAKGSDSLKIIEVARHTKFAYPLSTFILALIGVSLSSRKIRGGTGQHIGIGTGLCFSYILFGRIFEEFAKGGAMNPALAVWIPNIIYLFIAIYLYNKAPK